MHPLAPYALIYPMLGMQLAMMQTATGMFWFAWSPGAITNPKEEA